MIGVTNGKGGFDEKILKILLEIVLCGHYVYCEVECYREFELNHYI